MKVIPFAPTYQLDEDLALVWSSKSCQYLKPQINNRGYEIITLFHNGIKTTHSIHRLLAQLFIENPNKLPQVDHRDRNPLNNKLSNLRWVSVEDQVQNKIYKTTNKLGIKNIWYNKKKDMYIYTKLVNGKMYSKSNKNLLKVIMEKICHLHLLTLNNKILNPQWSQK